MNDLEKVTQQNKSVSATAADLIREALEMHEDLYVSRITNERISDASDQATISHDDAWG